MTAMGGEAGGLVWDRKRGYQTLAAPTQLFCFTVYEIYDSFYYQSELETNPRSWQCIKIYNNYIFYMRK